MRDPLYLILLKTWGTRVELQLLDYSIPIGPPIKLNYHHSLPRWQQTKPNQFVTMGGQPSTPRSHLFYWMAIFPILHWLTMKMSPRQFLLTLKTEKDFKTLDLPRQLTLTRILLNFYLFLFVFSSVDTQYNSEYILNYTNTHPLKLQPFSGRTFPSTGLWAHFYE